MPASAPIVRPRRFPRVLLTGLACLASAVVFPLAAHAVWVPQGAQLGPIPGDQLQPVTVPDGSGGMFVAWNDGRGVGEDIYVQRVDANGNPLWAQGGIVACNATGTQNDVQMISDGAGGVILGWWDFRSGISLYAQRIDAAGTRLWATNGVAITTLTCWHSFSMSSDGFNGAIFTYERCGTTTGLDIGAQRVNSAGSVRWGTTGVVVCAAANDQTSPGVSVTDDGSGSCIVSWADDREGTQIGNSIYAQKISSAGAMLWPGGGLPVSLYVAASNQWPVRVHGDGADGAVLTWYDAGIGTYKVWQQRVNGLGQSQWTTGGIRVCTALGSQYYPEVCRDGNGGSIVVWYDQRSDPLGDLYAQRISSTGTLQWDPSGVPVCLAPEEQYQYSIGADGANGAFVVWQDARADTASDIYAQHITDTGAWTWGDANGVAIGQAPLYQVMASMAPDGQGGLVAAWEDFRNLTDYEIYVTRVPNTLVAVGDPAGRADGRALTVSPSLIGRGRPAASIVAAGVRAPVAELVVSDIAGRVVHRATLRPTGLGEVRARWDGRGADGRAAANGVYAVTVRAGGAAWRHNIVVAR